MYMAILIQILPWDTLKMERKCGKSFFFWEKPLSHRYQYKKMVTEGALGVAFAILSCPVQNQI